MIPRSTIRISIIAISKPQHKENKRLTNTQTLSSLEPCSMANVKITISTSSSLNIINIGGSNLDYKVLKDQIKLQAMEVIEAPTR